MIALLFLVWFIRNTLIFNENLNFLSDIMYTSILHSHIRKKALQIRVIEWAIFCPFLYIHHRIVYSFITFLFPLLQYKHVHLHDILQFLWPGYKMYIYAHKIWPLWILYHAPTSLKNWAKFMKKLSQK